MSRNCLKPVSPHRLSPNARTEHVAPYGKTRPSLEGMPLPAGNIEHNATRPDNRNRPTE